MAYLGKSPKLGSYIKLDDISGSFNGVKTEFNLTSGGKPFHSSNPYSLFVMLGGVIQEPIVSYTIVRDQITFANAPLAGSQFYILVLGNTFHTGGLKSIPVTNRGGTILTIPVTATTLAVTQRTGSHVPVLINPA
tara:strand:+ start:113 stop:517 length:405 start_codon:yes stop_codon:yes gene_type:complete